MELMEKSRMQPMVRRADGITEARMGQLLDGFGSLRAGVVGDVCLDAYWIADLTRSTLSRETPHYTLPIVDERYSPGAAGNVAANLAALGCGKVMVCSVVGDDWRGGLLKGLLTARGIETSYLITDRDWMTPAYCKPIRTGLQSVQQEDARLDFQNFGPLPKALAEKLGEMLDAMASQCDIIAVTDQLPFGVIGDGIRGKLAEWAAKGKIVMVDSRERIGLYRGVIVKPNEVEASGWFREEATARTPEEWADLARRLSGEVQGVCCMTLGSEGAIWAEGDNCVFVPTRPVPPPIDIVGAGDAFAAASLCALGAGGTGPEAAALAHCASSVVIRKIGTTGTASPDEIRSVHAE
ncbi:bifunctional heptose 7-phosphate kinase/heptose 1-phosphate adenyltransferase [Cohnella sp. REN36]|uniref:bifunctional heptose 7-phosphate kinase/heptose 1-phosphate adenyltransferase n=1 Tax=Cohnella sp. REN36 TaxID=2887347 RepID=UPI001D14F542|nr:PfkB family carbohydrate kinase [Cohnella sp. REN36]MCC3371881.1 PfkB family carbohydrate kinase [Cohnella sp. REN36]